MKDLLVNSKPSKYGKVLDGKCSLRHLNYQVRYPSYAKPLVIKVNLPRKNLLSQNNLFPKQSSVRKVMTKLERSISGDLLL